MHDSANPQSHKRCCKGRKAPYSRQHCCKSTDWQCLQSTKTLPCMKQCCESCKVLIGMLAEHEDSHRMKQCICAHLA